MAGQTNEVSISTKSGVTLQAFLTLPKDAKGIVLFAHGSGSGRFSPRNQFVAKVLSQNGIATLLADLLTPQEEKIDDVTRELRFDIALLARRLGELCDAIKELPATKGLQIGYFGASTGAAAALMSAAEIERRTQIAAIVSRGGRPDLAGHHALPDVQAPTLLIVGGNDFGVIELNQEAYDALSCTKQMQIVAGATHLFEESGTLEEVARLATSWFTKHFSS